MQHLSPLAGRPAKRRDFKSAKFPVAVHSTAVGKNRHTMPLLPESEDTVTTAAFGQKENKLTAIKPVGAAEPQGFLARWGRGSSKEKTGAAPVATSTAPKQDSAQSLLGGAWTI